MKTMIEKAIDIEFAKEDGFQVVLNEREKARYECTLKIQHVS